MQHSLVVHLIWDQGVAGSNPVIPTIILFNSAGQLSWLEHPVHTRKVVSSSLTPATNEFNLDPQLSWSEHPAHNRRVVGSSPTGSTNYTYAEVPKWLKGPVLKTGRSCERRLGSNPSFCAILITRRSLVQILLPQPCGLIAQLVEQRTENPCVVGSIPTETTICQRLHLAFARCFFYALFKGYSYIMVIFNVINKSEFIHSFR